MFDTLAMHGKHSRKRAIVNCRYAKLLCHENSHFSKGVSYYSEGDYERKNAASSISFIVHKV
jgi:hypothetical protein